MVDDLLERYPLDPRLQRFCHFSGLDRIADRSTWADDVRNDDGSPFYGTGNWHFINIPRVASGGDLRPFCPRRRGCLISALEKEIAVLRSDRTEPRRRAEALMFVIHLAGDLHQPLHCVTNNDLGANCVPVAYFAAEPRRAEHRDSGRYEPNLHAVWDGAIIERITGRRGPVWFAERLERRFASELAKWEREPVDLEAWAWESHRVANETAYGRLPRPIPAESPQPVTHCGEMSKRVLKLHEHLAQTYQDAAVPVVEEQLAKAGVRLAMILNELWP